jgi:hypothetical protein
MGSEGRMVDSTHCSQCNGPLIEIDFYGERLVGCIECNRWTRDGWLFIHLPEEDLEALRADRGPETIAEFLRSVGRCSAMMAGMLTTTRRSHSVLLRQKPKRREPG